MNQTIFACIRQNGKGATCAHRIRLTVLMVIWLPIFSFFISNLLENACFSSKNGVYTGGGLFLSAQVPFVSDELPAQRNCSTESFFETHKTPEWVQNRAEIAAQTRRFVTESGRNLGIRADFTIPVVVHVLWNTGTENISDAQIQSQIEVLNQDFRRQNADRVNTPLAFQRIAADVGINFCLAQRTPDGRATNGIERKYNSTPEWGATDNMKRTDYGGLAGWDASKYLNIWVCNIGSGWLGYAQYPGGPTATDGVVIDFRYFGTTGSALPPFNRGRTTTHEVGHWLNLQHIWGDASCGNDFVDDTPPHRGANYGCPQEPLLSSNCTANTQEMPSNFMDYTNDNCMNLFTNGQKMRMTALLSAGGFRSNLANSDGCTPPPAILPCGTPTNLVASSVSTYAFQLNWTASANVVYYIVEVRPNAAVSFWSSYYAASNSLHVTRLRPSTTYFVRVKAVCAGDLPNLSPYSAQIIVNTPNTLITLPTAACEDNNEPNNSFSTAKRINFNNNVYATIGATTDRDWFVVAIPSGLPTVRIGISDLAADYDLKIFNAVGGIVATSESQGTANESVLLQNTSGGDYFIQIFGYNGAFHASRCYKLLAESVVGQTGGRKPSVAASQSLTLFPNPTNGDARLHVDKNFWNMDNKTNMEETELLVQISDISGRLCFSQRFDVNISEDINLPTTDLESGFYFVTLQKGNLKTVLKLSKTL